MRFLSFLIINFFTVGHTMIAKEDYETVTFLIL